MFFLGLICVIFLFGGIGIMTIPFWGNIIFAVMAITEILMLIYWKKFESLVNNNSGLQKVRKITGKMFLPSEKKNKEDADGQDAKKN
jgi:hypothetical protein